MRKNIIFIGFLLLASFCLSPPAGAEDQSVSAQNKHGLALYDEPKYPADFRHLDYVNPDAPKGGQMVFSAIGGFDNLNPFILKGQTAAGAGMVFETLLTATADEPFSEYGLLAETVSVPDDRSSVTFTLRKEARFNDGTPVTADDVIWSYETLKSKGHPFYRSYYSDIAKVEKTGPGSITFTFKSANNRELPLIVGQMPVLPEHAWKGKDFSETVLTPLIGSGPYKIGSLESGRSITYERVKDWWGKDLPINRGRYNFDTIRYDYYRDDSVALEALLAGHYDFREENIAKAWATAYDAPAVTAGLIKKQEIKNNNPSGLQAFVYNTRRPIFQDPRVREALAYAFDFEWSDAHLAYNAYTRSKSYFENSDLGATGLPSAAELKILEPFRGQVPDEVFTTEYQPPKTDGSGNIRENLKTALDLFKQAGWEIKGQKLTNVKTGEVFKFEILDATPAFERWVQPFIRNLERIGIDATFRIVDPAQYQNRLNQFDFDMTISVFGQSLSPGHEERNYFSSSTADQQGSHNFAGIKNPVVDALVEGLINARTTEDLTTHCRALDRVLLWNFYTIPQWHFANYRIAYWDKFGQPQTLPKYSLGVPDTWWYDTAKVQSVNSKEGSTDHK